jgi:hypothetical protein
MLLVGLALLLAGGTTAFAVVVSNDYLFSTIVTTP